MKVAIIGCGIVGATIAYELSWVSNLSITVFDQLPLPTYPSDKEGKFSCGNSTTAALGVLMSIISRKTKGQAWEMRQTSLRRYETLVPELEKLVGYSIPYNRQGILNLCFPEENFEQWIKLAEIRKAQGFTLEIWDKTQLQQLCPHINHSQITGAIYSPQDRQINPTALNLALIDGARYNGVEFVFGTNVLSISHNGDCVNTANASFDVDYLVITAGIGTSHLTANLQKFIDIRPVFGQALQLRVECSLGNTDFQPVITGNDLHLIPVGNRNYWVGSTVEFPQGENWKIYPQAELLQDILQQTTAFCPELAQSTIVRSWYGARPRPYGRPGPIIEKLPGFNNVFLATGHYRNGVLLAPATAIKIREMLNPR